MNEKVNLKGLCKEELEGYFVGLGEKAYRARQVMKWIYSRNETDFHKMTDLPMPLRDRLGEIARISKIHAVERFRSADGSEKFVFELEDGEKVESVFIPTLERKTICVSTQVGCPVGCGFCATGLLGFKRNLSSAEIIDQHIQVGVLTGMHGAITNVVFMGMGEPLLNLDEVIRTIKILTSNFGFELSARHITVSTCGIPEKIYVLADTGLRVKLAISLNATSDSIRKKIMPSLAKIADIIKAAKYYAEKTRRWVTFEYVLIKGVNDSLSDAKRLVEIVKQVPSKVNLIPFNMFGETQYQPPDKKTVLRFQAYLLEQHITAIIRESRGQDIFAACGQLGTRK